LWFRVKGEEFYHGVTRSFTEGRGEEACQGSWGYLQIGALDEGSATDDDRRLGHLTNMIFYIQNINRFEICCRLFRLLFCEFTKLAREEFLHLKNPANLHTLK